MQRLSFSVALRFVSPGPRCLGRTFTLPNRFRVLGMVHSPQVPRQLTLVDTRTGRLLCATDRLVGVLYEANRADYHFLCSPNTFTVGHNSSQPPYYRMDLSFTKGNVKRHLVLLRHRRRANNLKRRVVRLIHQRSTYRGGIIRFSKLFLYFSPIKRAAAASRRSSRSYRIL